MDVMLLLVKTLAAMTPRKAISGAIEPELAATMNINTEIAIPI